MKMSKSNHVGGEAMTRLVLLVWTDRRTDGQADSYIPPKLRLWGYN